MGCPKQATTLIARNGKLGYTIEQNAPGGLTSWEDYGPKTVWCQSEDRFRVFLFEKGIKDSLYICEDHERIWGLRW